VGCGTGISASLFEREGYSVTGIEPNTEMREEAARQPAGSSRFRVLPGTAEQIPLPDASCELAVAAQAFHWFEPVAFRKELMRVLVPNGWVSLLWNVRRTDTSPFLRAYEQLLQAFGTDYALVTQGWDDAAVTELFGAPNYARRVFDYHQDFDLRGLVGRALSSSYVPGPEHPAREQFVSALEAAFNQHAHDGTVRFEYDTRLFFGRLSSTSEQHE
jgi:SAM-dependent methyltransferase